VVGHGLGVSEWMSAMGWDPPFGDQSGGGTPGGGEKGGARCAPIDKSLSEVSGLKRGHSRDNQSCRSLHESGSRTGRWQKSKSLCRPAAPVLDSLGRTEADVKRGGA